MIETKPRINRMRQPWTAVSNCGPRQDGVARQKVEHQRESSGLPNARGSRFRMGPNSRIRPRHSARLRTMNKRTEISCRCRNKLNEKSKTD